MAYIIVKYAVTAGVIVVVSEVAKRSDRLGALISSLPMVTVLTLIWLHFEKQPSAKIENHAYYTFWYVLPTLPMFLLFPYMHTRFGFWSALGLSAIITVMAFAVTALVLKRFGINLF